ncbi:MAG: hydrolase [Campylobacterota bacterium]
MINKFEPSFILRNRHIQTLYSSLFTMLPWDRKLPIIDMEIEKFNLEDGDFLECYWHNKPRPNSSTPIVILFHGLAGSYKSSYIQGTMNELAKNGFASVLMHFRGCSGVENSLPRSYHSGESGDALEWVNHLISNFPNSKIFTIGYSLGGNMMLKLLGELGNKSPITAAISISAPVQLDTCANKMDRGFSKFYQHILLKDLNAALKKKYDKFDMSTHLDLKKSEIKNLKTFWKFDGAYTAPIHGFESAQDYYTKCSSKQFLKDIKTPTLIIHSRDDPFMTTDILPNEDEISEYITLEVSDYGGHVGFIGGSLFKPDYWLEKRVLDYFTAF